MKMILALLFSLASLTAWSTEPGAPATPAPEKNVLVELHTSAGDITLELDAKAAPKTVANFLRYVDEGFYSKTLFHRVIANFMIQGGGFQPGMVEKPTHAPVANESGNGLKNQRGTIAMARTQDPDSATAQFFINLVDNAYLNSQQLKQGYTVFGRVVHGMDVVDKIGQVKTAQVGMYGDVPVEDVVIISAKRIP